MGDRRLVVHVQNVEQKFSELGKPSNSRQTRIGRLYQIVSFSIIKISMSSQEVIMAIGQIFSYQSPLT